MTQPTTITLDQLIREAIEARIAEINVSLPCKVLSYDSSKNTAKLQPLLKRRRRKKDGTVTATEIPSLQGVPVAFQRVNGSWITLPVQAGDVGMVVFCQRSIAEWMGKQRGDVVEPKDETLHPFGGAWFYPGASPGADPIQSPGSNPTWHTDTSLDLGEKNLTANDLVAIGQLVDSRLSTIQATYDAHFHPSGMGPTGVPTVLIGSLASTKATKVRAK